MGTGQSILGGDLFLADQDKSDITDNASLHLLYTDIDNDDQYTGMDH